MVEDGGFDSEFAISRVAMSRISSASSHRIELCALSRDDLPSERASPIEQILEQRDQGRHSAQLSMSIWLGSLARIDPPLELVVGKTKTRLHPAVLVSYTSMESRGDGL